MAITVFPPTQSQRQLQRMRDRLSGRMARLSTAASPYTQQVGENVLDGAIGVEITPIYRAEHHPSDRLPGLSFSAQLLELGLKHNVEGLIQKAQHQLSYDGAQARSPQQRAAKQYEQAQDYFARDTLHMVERQY
jgi:hypothetical protein